jgi:hypothetical protein
MKTVWLTSAQVLVISEALKGKEDETSLSIKREFNVAKVRASSSRVLNKSFLSAVGKEDKLPFRFNESELNLLSKVAEDYNLSLDYIA